MSWRFDKSCHTYTHMSQSWMWHIWTCHMTHTSESLSHMTESWHTHEWVNREYVSKRHLRTGQVYYWTPSNNICARLSTRDFGIACRWVCARVPLRRSPICYKSWCTNRRVIPHTWTIHVNGSVVTCHIYTCGNRRVMPHMWTIHMHRMCECDMSQVWQRHTTHLSVSCCTHEGVMSHMWTCHVTHMNASCRPCECVMPHTSSRHVTRQDVMPHMWICRSPIKKNCC